MIKHIFCDLDGTLYHGGINQEDIDAINKIEKEGVVFHIATGRIFKQAHAMTKDGLDIKGYYICENGSYIHDKDHNIIFKGTIDDEIVKKVISRFDSEDSHIYFKYNGDIVLINDSKGLKRYTNEYIIDGDFIKRETFDNAVGNIGVVSENIDELCRIELYLKSEFSEILDIYFSAENVINIVPKGVSKRESIKRICKMINVSEDEIATIGDSPNDINMLDGLKYSFAMENARDSVKEHANYVAKSVADAIQKISQINKDLN